MAHDIQRTRRGERPRAVSRAGQPDSQAADIPVEEGIIENVDRLPKPDGFGTEASRSAQSFAVIDDYIVPAGHVARIREAALSIESNGEAFISINGTRFGPFTGAGDVSVPLDPGILPPGYRVSAVHQSTDGNSTTTQAQLVVLEV
jgi:hypothetical protein